MIISTVWCDPFTVLRYNVTHLHARAAVRHGESPSLYHFYKQFLPVKFQILYNYRICVYITLSYFEYFTELLNKRKMCARIYWYSCMKTVQAHSLHSIFIQAGMFVFKKCSIRHSKTTVVEIFATLHVRAVLFYFSLIFFVVVLFCCMFCFFAKLYSQLDDHVLILPLWSKCALCNKVWHIVT